MELSKNSKVYEALAEENCTIGEFLRAIMGLKNLSTGDVAKLINSSQAYVYMVTHDQCAFGKRACLNFASALDIDPVMLYKVYSGYGMKVYIQNLYKNDTATK